MNRGQIEKYIEEYGRDIYSFCTYLTRNKEDADDLYQQTFLTAIQKDEIEDSNNPKAYLNAVAANLWNNHKRKYLWRKNKADIVYMQSEDMETIADEQDSIFDQVAKNEDAVYVRQLVAKLPDKLKVVILMYYMQNLSIEEIAIALDISPGTVKSRLFNAKAKLKEGVEGRYER